MHNQNKHPIITFAYHFLCEAMIIFLIAVPVMHLHYKWVPYWSYLGIAFAFCLVFSVISKITANYSWYFLTALLMMLSFYLFEYPLLMCFAFSVILTWRYINIRRESNLSRELTYIKITLILSAVLIIMVKDGQILLYAILQFVILIIGNISSHIAIMKKAERRQIDHKLWLYILGLFALGIAIILPIFGISQYLLKKIWAGFSFIIVYFHIEAGKLAQILNLESLKSEQEIDVEYDDGGSMDRLGSQQPLIEIIMPFIYYGALIFIIGFIIILAVLLFKNRFSPRLHSEKSDVVSYSDVEEKPKHDKKNMRNIFNHYYNKLDHPVRKMIFQFERKAAKNEKGRKRFETVEDWLKRIGMPTDLSVYQKVRYGEMDVSEKEIEDLKVQLKEMEARLKYAT